jgi:DNA-directed RNA polymerase specialized sigma24 family protein
MRMLPGSSVTATVAGPAEEVSRRLLLVQALGRLPAGQRQVIVLRRRRARRARATAALTTLPLAAAAIAAAVFLPRPATRHAQDTAYVVSHVAQALDAVPASTIFFGWRHIRRTVTRSGTLVVQDDFQ